MTQPFWPLLTTVLLLASPAEEPAEAVAGWQSMLDHYAGLGPAEQRQWFHELLGRLNRANWLALAPDQAAAEQVRLAALLRASAQGRPVPQAELLPLLRETDRQEKAAVERLARRFRMQVYDTFRLQREEYARRRAAWDGVQASWQAAGSPFHGRPQMIDWLVAAIRNSTAGSVARLPGVPGAGPLAGVPQPLLLPQATERPGQPPPLVRPQPVEPPSPTAPASGLRTPNEPSNGQAQPAGRPVPLPRVIPRTMPGGRASPGPAVVPGPAAPSAPQPAELPPVSREAPAAIVPARPLSPQDAAALAGDGPRRATDAPSRLIRQPPPDVLAADRVGPPVVPFAAPRLPAADGSAAGATRAGQPPPRTADRPAAGRWLVEPLPKSPGVPPVASQTAAPSPQPAAARPPHRVNLAELAARIAGTNLALRALEAELEAEQPWDARRLGPLVDRLGMLVVRSGDLAMFYELVSPRERARVGRLDSSRRAISRLAARVAEARTRASGPDFTGTQSEREAELRDLDDLSAQLAEMAPRK